LTVNLRRLRFGLVSALASACILAGGTGSSLALFSDAASAGSNSITAGRWTAYVLYLHSNPTPPTGNTTAKYDLSATAAAPTASTLYRYDTDGANRAGRGLTRTATPGSGLTTALAYVNWLTPPFASSFTIMSTATVGIWSATNTTAANRTGSIVAYLRDYDPVARSYVDVGSATYTAVYRTGRTFYSTPITISRATPYVVAAGHLLELKIEAPTASSTADMLLAYDTVPYPASLALL
jgi:predicted ribosomally synthesized peptide with SipW-like signal peptide